jgi:hypothetical protein
MEKEKIYGTEIRRSGLLSGRVGVGGGGWDGN